MRYVPVIDKNDNPLMPTTICRANSLLRRKRAIYFWRQGIFCIKLLDRVGGETQSIAVGIDPGSKREAMTIKSNHHTYLNIQSKAVDWVKSKIASRLALRRNRRYRKTPYRECRPNRQINDIRIPPSTRARWQTKLRILNILRTIFPITYVVVEDIQAITKPNQRRWNASFSPLEVGKNWFYQQVNKHLPCFLRAGGETSQMRNDFGLKKSSQKLSTKFEAHCVDSWVLANSAVGGHIEPDNKNILLMNPIPRNRRALHDQLPRKNGWRRERNSKSMIQKGALVKMKDKLFLVGGLGSTKNSVSLNDMDNKRIKRSVVISKLNIIDNYNKWGSCYA